MPRWDNVRVGGEELPMSSIPSGSGMLDKTMVFLKISTWLWILSRS